MLPAEQDKHNGVVEGLIYRYTDHESDAIRWIAVASSIISIVAGIFAFCFFVFLKQKLFRHSLIFQLLIYDFFKAVILIIFPLQLLRVKSSYDDVVLCDSLGFLTSLCVEGADFAVLFLAIHTALVIFRKRGPGQPAEGLERFRYAVYSVNFLIPALIASLAFISGPRGFVPDISWCMLPIHPTWYRLALSWVPRGVILATILAIYIAVYVHVRLEYRKVAEYIYKPESSHRVGFRNRITKMIHQLPTLANKRPHREQHGTTTTRTRTNENSSFNAFDEQGQSNDYLHSSAGGPNWSSVETLELRQASLAEVNLRRAMIERQMRLIFVYPACYFCLWLMPFILECRRYANSIRGNEDFWMTCISAAATSLNCAVDTLVFVREFSPKYKKSLGSNPVCAPAVRVEFDVDVFKPSRAWIRHSVSSIESPIGPLCQIDIREFLATKP